MNLPYDLCFQLIHYLQVKDLFQYRISSKESCDNAKLFEGYPFMINHSVKGCIKTYFKCFPNIKYADLSESNIYNEDFSLFRKVEELSLSVMDMDKEDMFQNGCLKKLFIYSQFRKDNEYYHFIDPMFKYLNNLSSLFVCRSGYITDDALFHLTNLKELYLWECYLITSNAIRQLKNLKKLRIADHFGMNDSAFEGSQIEDLIIHYHSNDSQRNSSITDKGILQLSQLKTLDCKNAPLIRGSGFNQLKQLHSLTLGGIHFQTHVSDLDHIENLFFCNCSIEGKYPEKWKKLKKLKFYRTTFDANLEFLYSLCKVSPLLQEIKFIMCPIHSCVPLLNKTFGSRLVCIDLNVIL